ncbi:MAG: sulfurtransferase [Vicinamibacterales bacterium]
MASRLVLAAAAALLVTATQGRAQTPAQRFARPDLIVDGDWLARNLSAPGLRIVDMRPRGYADGHIPGAVWLDNNAIRSPKAPPTFLPTPQEFASLMGRLGISDTTRVVVYDERGGLYAARLWWILNLHGHANVALLDGGWPGWVAGKRAVDAAVPAVAPAVFTVRKGTVGVATADDVKAAINNPAVRLVDARTQGEIDGRDLRGIKRGGYIESSIPVYWEDLLDASTRAVKGPAEVEALWRGKGIGATDQVIVYCQVGMRASYDLWTLALLGHDLTRLRNYYGAWEEWGNREDTPVVRKDE